MEKKKNKLEAIIDASKQFFFFFIHFLFCTIASVKFPFSIKKKTFIKAI